MKHADLQKLRVAGLITNEQRRNSVAPFRVNKNSCVVFAQASVNRFCHAFLMAFLILTLAGCKTANVNSPLAVHPEKYRRVAVLPICFGNASPTGFTTETGESEAVGRESGAELASALTNRLAKKGYQVVNPVRVLSSEKDWCGIDLTASGILRQQFDLERIRANPGETNALYTYGFVSALPVLQESLSLPEADAVILVERWEGYVAPAKADKSLPLAAKIVVYPVGIAAVTFMGAMMIAGGDIPDLVNTFGSGQLSGTPASPPAQPEISTCYSLYVFDPSEHQIIYSACESRRFQSLTRAARALLRPLPKVNEQ